MRKQNLLLFIFLVGLSQLSHAQSSPEYINGTDTLVVYRSIPNLPEFMPRVEAAETKDIRVISDKYTIKVRSVATNGVWVDVLALYTYNRALEIPDQNMLSGTIGSNSSTVYQHYPNATAGWSQTYGNIEISNNHPIEVEIAPVGSFKIGGNNFSTVAVHPAQKASAVKAENGKVYFTISNPGQVAIDINGQMDDYNAFVNPIGAPTDGVSSFTVPIHTITLFANPVLKKPVLNSSRTFYVENGVMPTVSPSTYDTLYFKPGVHDIGMNQKIYPGKAVYIPGDAIVFGSINNWGVPFTGFTKVGEKIKIYGYGTISGARTKHPYYVANPFDIAHKTIAIDNPLNYQIIGVAVVDPANFSVYTPSGAGGFLSYVKVIGWRANGDGLGNGDNVNDCFVRTNDDCSYVRGSRKRVTYWKDNISGIFYMSEIWDNTRPILIEDCDILYCRSRGGGGAAWDMRGDAPIGQRPVQVTFRNIRLHDPRSNMTIFNLVNFKGDAAAPTQVGGNYTGIKFENISIKSSLVKSNLMGCVGAPWNGGLTFENVTFAGTKLTAANFNTFFNTNQYVNSMVFKSTDYYTVTNTTNPHQGYIIMEPNAPNYIVNSRIALFPIARPGYRFTGWSGVNYTGFPAPLNMNADKTIAANFTSTGTDISSPTTSATENITVYPNPATDILFFNSTDKQVDKIQLVDLTGKIVYSTIVQLQNGSIDLKGIAKGLYLVKIHVENNIVTKKISIK